MNKTVRRILLILLIGIFCFSTGKSFKLRKNFFK